MTDALDMMDVGELVALAQERGWGQRQFTEHEMPVAWIEQAMRVALRQWLVEEDHRAVDSV